MPEIQVPELARKLARRLGVTGGNVAPSLAPEVVPVVLVEDVVSPSVHDVGDVRLCVGSAGVAAGGAGTYVEVQLRNQPNSGLYVLLDSALCHTTGAAAEVTIHAFDTNLTSKAGSTEFVDRRLAGTPAAHVRHHTPAALDGTLCTSLAIPSAETVAVPMNWILGPGHGVLIAMNTANQHFFVGFNWAEVASQPSP